MLTFRPEPRKGFSQAVGIGGIGRGIVFALEGDHTLGRNESRLGALLDVRDYCKLHIVSHYISRLMGCGKNGTMFHVLPIGVVGGDSTGQELIREMQEAGVDTQFVRTDPESRTQFSVCFVYPDGTGGNITTSNSASSKLTAADLGALKRRMKDAGKRGLAVCLPEVPLGVRKEFLEMATECGNYRAASFVLSEIPEVRNMNLFALVDLLSVNQEEASALVDYAFELQTAEGFLADVSSVLTRFQPSMSVVLSAGGLGAYGYERGEWRFARAPKSEVAATAGAGDALLAGVLSALSAGLKFLPDESSTGIQESRLLDSALDFGVVAASYSVTSPHTIHPGADLSRVLDYGASKGFQLSDALRATCHEVASSEAPLVRVK